MFAGGSFAVNCTGREYKSEFPQVDYIIDCPHEKDSVVVLSYNIGLYRTLSISAGKPSKRLSSVPKSRRPW
jgi:hypothetical protein